MIYGNLTSPEIGRLAPNLVAILPLAAIEQHGDHLPVDTDTEIVTALAQRVESELPKSVILLPTLWVGSSHHHFGFRGTLSLSSENYVRVLIDLVESLVTNGFRRIFLLNGHGGNQTPFAEALYRLSLAHENDPVPPWIAAQSYWKLAGPALARQTFMDTPALSHACEYETSLMLALDAKGLNLDLAQGTARTPHSRYYDPLGYGSSIVTVCETFRQLSQNGALGSPELASAEKGHQLIDLISASLIDFIQEFSTWPFRSNPEKH